jgi:mannose PTS system EIIA component
MAQLLVIAHAPLASALLAVAKHAYPECSRRLAAVDVDPQADVALTQASIHRALQTLKATAPTTLAPATTTAPMAEPAPIEVLVLTDVLGATPFNVALATCSGASVRIVTGVNVPMLWRVLCYADQPLEDLVERALAGATQGTQCADKPVPCDPTQPAWP